jgi:hypothetical protein
MAEIQSMKQSYSQYNQPLKIAPIKVYPSAKRAKSTFDAIDESRIQSPRLSDKGCDLVFSKVVRRDSTKDYV